MKTAVSQTLQVLFAPYDFYSNVLDARGNGLLKIDHLKNETRYLRINKAPLDKLVEKLNERKAELITGNEAFALLDHILEEVNFSPEDIDGYVVAFSKLTPLNVAGLFESKSEPLKAAVSKPAEQKPQPANEGLSKNEFQIKDALTINQKFMFTKMLFSGDFELFTQAIEQLDKLGSANEAVVYLNKNYPHWDKESDEYEEFFAVVQRKFGS